MSMLVTSKFFEKLFVGETHKQAYLEASKWIAKNVVSKVEIGETLWRIEKMIEADLPTCKLTLYVALEEGTMRKSDCERCRQFHSLFYMNQQYNCDKCNATAYRKSLEQKLKIKQSFRKEQINRVIEVEEE